MLLHWDIKPLCFLDITSSPLDLSWTHHSPWLHFGAQKWEVDCHHGISWVVDGVRYELCGIGGRFWGWWEGMVMVSLEGCSHEGGKYRYFLFFRLWVGRRWEEEGYVYFRVRVLGGSFIKPWKGRKGVGLGYALGFKWWWAEWEGCWVWFIKKGPFGVVIFSQQGPTLQFIQSLGTEIALFQKYHKDYSCHITIS